jgi:Icc-related predicted phosphoesterase
MKIVLISDTHCRLRKVEVPEGDLLLHAGDLTFRGDHEEIWQELRELGRIAKNFKHGCVFIAGNHDWLGERDPSLMKQMAIDEGLIYLDHSSIQIEGLNIFGSAYTPFFCNWAFNVYRGEALAEKWAQIPDNTDILITHGPPMGILDPVERFNKRTGEVDIEHVGCEDLYSRIQQLKQLKLHVFGHIHLGYGQLKIGDITYVNASVCTESYKPINSPIVIEL